MEDFEQIYLAHFTDVYKYVFSLCRDSYLAEEITQEAFYKAMEHIDRFDGKCKLYVWLCQIAKNTYYSYFKKQKRNTLESEQPNEPEVSIERALHELPEPYKEVFSLRVFGELPFSQIGALFGKTDSWARLIFYRAKKELRRGLDEDTV